MNINEVLAVVLLLAIVAAAAITYVVRSRKPPAEPPVKLCASADSFRMHPAEDRSIVGDLVLLDSQGGALLSLARVGPLPDDAIPLVDGEGIALKHANQLAADLIARSMTVAGKTIEIMFHRSALDKLLGGTLEMIKVKPGSGPRMVAGTLDTGKFVGHGHILETGRQKQIALGIRQLTQVAMAEAELAELPRNQLRLAITFDRVERPQLIHVL
jgi:hypothetical protein